MRRLPLSKAKGEITVFLALSIVLVASLLLSTVELYRTQASKTYLTQAANSAVDSLFSQYHLELWENYRLLGYEMYLSGQAEEEVYDFIAPYFSKSDVYNWYALKTDREKIRLNEYRLMTDDGGKVFEENVKNYMLFGTAAGLSDAYPETELGTLKSGEAAGEASSQLSRGSRQAQKLQKKLDRLSEDVAKAEEARQKLKKAVAGGSGVEGCLSVYERLLQTVTGDMDALEPAINALKSDIETMRGSLSSDLTEADRSLMESQISALEEYTEETGSKRRELESLEEDIRRNEEQCAVIREEAEQAEEEIRSFVPGEILAGYLPPKKEGDPPIPVYEEEALDESACWADCREACGELVALNFSTSSGAVDKELAEALEEVSDLLCGSLFTLIYPEGVTISRETHDRIASPSSLYLKKTGILEGTDLITQFAVGRYAGMKLTCLKTGERSAAEQEYVLCGRDSDYDNVAAFATELMGVRTGLNLTYLLSDPKSVKEATTLAASVTGLAAGTPLFVITVFLILSVWAAGQAVLDVRKLLLGGKVPMIHTKKTFTLGLGSLLHSFKSEIKKVALSKDEKEVGLSYEEYCGLAIYLRNIRQTDYRIMDVIQENIRKLQPDFTMDRLVTGAEIGVEATSKHVFWQGWGQTFDLYVTAYTEY